MKKHKDIVKPENENALKHLFNRALLQRMSKAILQVYPKFQEKDFLALMPQLDKLEMKPRVRLIRDELKRQLPIDYPKALEILLKSSKHDKLDSFDLWPYTEFIQVHGLDHLQISLDALKEITQKFTAEWAVRPFLTKHQEKTLNYLNKCAQDKNVHIRRWASEGSRPRLPWGERLHSFVKDPEATLQILEKLKFDEELYVRKSVSNHLNDISKNHPEKVIKTLTAWKKQAGSQHAEKINWIIYRSLRSLIKEGHPGALKLIGISNDTKIKVQNFKISSKKIKMGERLDFEFQIKSRSNKSQKLVVDYIIHFVKANSSTAPKVFKLKNLDLPAGSDIKINKSHHMKAVTTRQYYAGEHWLEIQINGSKACKQNWFLKI